MSTPVDRLQGLLQRVQTNRQKPRGVSPGVVQREAAQVAQPPARPAPAREPLRAEPRADMRREPPAPEPREVREAPTATVPRPPSVEARPRAAEAAAKVSMPPPNLQAAPVDQPRVIDPAPAQPSRPIAQTVGKHPPATAHSFGDLLRRSLALRPR